METRVEIEGLEEVARRIKSVLSPLEGPDVTAVLLRGAKIIRDEARRRAPVYTGTLKRSIKARRGKRRAKYYATAYAAADRKIAPHAHLVEYGTVKMNAKPYWRPAVDATREQVMRTVNEGIAALIGRAAR